MSDTELATEVYSLILILRLRHNSLHKPQTHLVRGVTCGTETPDQAVHHLRQPLLKHLLGPGPGGRSRAQAGQVPQPAAAGGGDPDHTIQD